MAWFNQPRRLYEPHTALVHQKAKTPRRLITPDPTNPRRQLQSVDFRWPTRRPGTSTSPISQLTNEHFIKRWELCENTAQSKREAQKVEALGDTTDIDGRDFAAEIDTQLKELRSVVESLETESHEEMMARLQQQQMQEQMEASEKPPPVASTPGAANKNSSVEKIYNQLETFRDSEMLHEQLVFRNKRTIQDRTSTKVDGTTILEHNRMLAARYTHDFQMFQGTRKFAATKRRVISVAQRKKAVADEKLCHMLEIQRKALARSELMESKKIAKQNARIHHNTTEKIKQFLPLIMAALRIEKIEKSYKKLLKLRQKNKHRIWAIVRVQRWIRPYLEKKRRKKILRGFARLKALFQGYRDRMRLRLRKRSAAVIIDFTNSLLEHKGSEMTAAVRSFLYQVRRTQRAWRAAQACKEGIVTYRCSQIEDYITRLRECEHSTEIEDEQFVEQFEILCKQNSMVMPSEPWAHMRFIKEQVESHYQKQRRVFVKEMDAFRSGFRVQFKEYEVEVFKARAALLLTSGSKAKCDVTLPVFDPPPRPEVKDSIDDQQLIMKMALDAIANTKSHQILPPDNFASK